MNKLIIKNVVEMINNNCKKIELLDYVGSVLIDMINWRYEGQTVKEVINSKKYIELKKVAYLIEFEDNLSILEYLSHLNLTNNNNTEDIEILILKSKLGIYLKNKKIQKNLINGFIKDLENMGLLYKNVYGGWIIQYKGLSIDNNIINQSHHIINNDNEEYFYKNIWEIKKQLKNSILDFYIEGYINNMSNQVAILFIQDIINHLGYLCY